MENTENNKKEEINVGDYVKVKSNLFVTVTKNIYASICKVVDKFGLDGDINSPIYIIRTCDKNWYNVAVTHYAIEKIEPDVEMLSQIEVIDENACKKMHDFCYGKDALKGVKTPIEVQDFEQVTSEMRELYKQKNHDYGNSFGRSFQKYGLISAITRMSDKWERIDSLCQKQAEVKDESIRDTLIDLANYCVMTVMELDKRKPDTNAGETFEMRLEKEWQELTNRIEKLSTFINSQKADSVSQYQRELLSEQLTHMTAYKVVLEKRITDLSQGNKQ